MGLNARLVQWMDKTFYPDVKNNWDNDYFRDLVLPHLDAQSTVLLDVGAGRGALPQMNFRDHVKKAVGVDPEPEIAGNPYLHEFHVGLGDNMPFLSSDSFDVVVSNNVLEHIADPDKFFAEIARVTKPSGIIITKTPNLTHYMPLIAMITPQSFHVWINKLRGRPAVDTFPTRYMVNTRSAQKAAAARHGLAIEQFILLEKRPEYLRMTFPTYLAGMLYERAVNFLGLDALKIVLFTVMRKTPR
ncbi:MAG: class I SAM-dependent methyltransferase [Beijerinckiaceae bacterium]